MHLYSHLFTMGILYCVRVYVCMCVLQVANNLAYTTSTVMHVCVYVCVCVYMHSIHKELISSVCLCITAVHLRRCVGSVCVYSSCELCHSSTLVWCSAVSPL